MPESEKVELELYKIIRGNGKPNTVMVMIPLEAILPSEKYLQIDAGISAESAGVVMDSLKAYLAKTFE